MKFGGYIAKRKAENVLMYPFILAGRLLAALSPLKTEYDVFYFFPFYHTGGAEKVHAQITHATGNRDSVIFFTRKSVDKTFLEDFRNAGCDIRDISKFVDNNWLYFLKFIWRGKIAAYINSQEKKPVVFNGQSNFGYKISPWINASIKQVELIHSFNTFSWIRLPFLPFIHQTIMISRRRIEEHLEQYKRLNVPGRYANRIQFIQNAVYLPRTECAPKKLERLRILFVGRGTPEKRPELFVEIARAAEKENIHAYFSLVGSMPDSITSDLPGNLTPYGNISDEDELHRVYCMHDILVIPSSTEGFPIVLMEAMGRGCPVMATPVGDIPDHVITDRNGYLFTSVEANEVVSQSIEWLRMLNAEKLNSLSANARAHALKNFGIEEFNRQYKVILQS
ncbi:MAG: hypothetical protein K0Q66_2200 [Chitinophagaceae bacterium]|nr:hypothetical protein [Chitinophagaceae bacterium]